MQTDTIFLPTLELPVVKGKNVIYSAAFLYAWEESARQLPGNVVITEHMSPELISVIRSKSHKNALAQTDYTVDVKLQGNNIIADAFYHKMLPLAAKMQPLETPLSFAGQQVQAFGMISFDEAIKAQCKLQYYKDDNHFVLKLTPEDKNYEILLVKGAAANTTLAGVLLWIEDVGTSRWAINNEIRDGDVVLIPRLAFNLSTNYATLEGQLLLTTSGEPYRFRTAFQQTAFLLDENGGTVESMARVELDWLSGGERPKKLVFDEPFYIVVKRMDTLNPCLMMKVENTELMQKREE